MCSDTLICVVGSAQYFGDERNKLSVLERSKLPQATLYENSTIQALLSLIEPYTPIWLVV
jgi:hypothetical protein